MLFEFVCPVSVFCTNLGMGQRIDEKLHKACYGYLLNAESVIGEALAYRTLKDFTSQVLPFKQFVPDAFFYYTLLVAFLLFETFKEDVCAGLVPLESYPTTLRRKVIDGAAKIARTTGKVTLKIAAAPWDFLGFDELRKRISHPPDFCWT